MQGDSFVSLVVCGRPMVCASAILNENAFPSTLELEATATTRRIAIFLYHVNALPLELVRSRQDFYTHLRRNWESYVTLKARSPVEYIAFADGLGYLACLHSILYELKACLDLFTRLVCRLVSPDPGPHGFNKGRIEGHEVAGGRLINWLLGRSIEVLPNRDALVDLIHAASQQWITAAIDVRDTLGHYRDLPGFRHMRVSISNGPATISPNDILHPEMPNGDDLVAYALQHRDQLCGFLSDALRMLPNIKTELNEPWDTAARYLQE